MLQRIITGLVGLALIVVAFLLIDTIAFTIIISIIVGIGVSEMICACKLNKSKSLFIISLVTAVIFPFVISDAKLIISLLLAFAIALFAVLLKHYNSLTFYDIGFTYFIVCFVGLGISSVTIVGCLWPEHNIFMILMCLVPAWSADIFAYFTGLFFGKHKLAPHVSPKKTIEGSIGGFVGAVAFTLLCAYYYQLTNDIIIDFVLLGVVSFIIAGVGMVGDLVFSIIKRQCEIKDYGNLLPGHGGILDRFDSVIIALPTMLVLYNLLPIIK